MQAAMLMNKLKAGAETSKLLAAAAAAAATTTPATTTASTVSVLRGERPKGRGRNRQNQVSTFTPPFGGKNVSTNIVLLYLKFITNGLK